jgi:hypothetical protein
MVYSSFSFLPLPTIARRCFVAFPLRSTRAAVDLEYGAHNRIRTDDLFLTKEVLYLLSYVSKSVAPIPFSSSQSSDRPGAGSGNRTRVISLEG